MYERKKKPCPICGKLIHLVSKACRSCSQTGENNNHYVNGLAAKGRTCSICGKVLSSGSKKGLCSECRPKSYIGNNNPNYKKGAFTNLVYSLEEYKAWRQAVRKRDNYTCKMCGSFARGQMEAHHIFPKSIYENLVFDIDNGITLCKACHRKTYGKELEYIKYLLDLEDHAKVKFRELLETLEEGNQQPSELVIA